MVLCSATCIHQCFDQTTIIPGKSLRQLKLSYQLSEVQEGGMDFQITPEQKALQKEADAFFDEVMKNAPIGWLGTMEDVSLSKMYNDFHRSVARKMGEKGWLSLTWPREYGGMEASEIDRLIIEESRNYHEAPGVCGIGIGMVAPLLIHVGTEVQKREHLPRMASGNEMWCRGWSEPNAGSDIANVNLTAVLDGDDYVLNGQKTWTSGAHFADWIDMIVVTDHEKAKHKRLSYFIVDMKTPGITVHPILNMAKQHMWNDTYFDDVRVPKQNMIGEKNRGWGVAMAAASFERGGAIIGWIASTKRSIDDLIQFCQETMCDGEPLVKKPEVRNRLAQLRVEYQVGRSLAYRMAILAEKGE